jgi:hypothetical protein
MNPDDIRRLYHQEAAATDTEAAETARAVTTDPAEARRLLLVLYAMAGEDRRFATLLTTVLQAATMQLLLRAVEADDAFALQIGALILEAQEQTSRPATPRGKAKPTRSA